MKTTERKRKAEKDYRKKTGKGECRNAAGQEENGEHEIRRIVHPLEDNRKKT